jgi:ABC-2 type transport system permease protein
MIRTLLRNLSQFDNLKTIFVSFLISPFFTVLFFFMISPGSNASKLILTSLALTMIYGIVGIYSGMLVYALSADILKQIFISWKGLFKFNAAVLLIANTVSLLQALILFIIYKILGFEIQMSFANTLMMIVLIVLFSSIFAMLCGLASLQNNNPYFFSNLLTGLLPILSATIIPISNYPTWLALLSKILPFWTIQNIVWKYQLLLEPICIYLVLSLLLLGAVIVLKRKRILQD